MNPHLFPDALFDWYPLTVHEVFELHARIAADDWLDALDEVVDEMAEAWWFWQQAHRWIAMPWEANT